MFVTITMEYTAFPNLWRGRLFYYVSAAVYPLVLAAAARSGRLRWPATTTAAIFMLASLVLSWVLQSVPATARLAPINNPVTHLVAAPFPIALIVPAAVFDLLHRAVGSGRDWRLSALLGVGFVVALLAVSWPLSGFLLSPAAQSPVFLAGNWDFSATLGAWRFEYWDTMSEGSRGSVVAAFAKVLLLAALFAAVSSRLGIALGSWMRKVRR